MCAKFIQPRFKPTQVLHNGPTVFIILPNVVCQGNWLFFGWKWTRFYFFLAASRLQRMALWIPPVRRNWQPSFLGFVMDASLDQELLAHIGMSHDEFVTRPKEEFRLRAVLRCIRIDGLGFKYIWCCWACELTTNNTPFSDGCWASRVSPKYVTDTKRL